MSYFVGSEISSDEIPVSSGSRHHPQMSVRAIRVFLLLLTLHSSLLLTSTLAGSKIFWLPFGFSASATVISYMFTFIILDAIGELFGRNYGKYVIGLGLIGMVLSVLYCQFAIVLPPASFWNHETEFETILGSSWRIWLGGWTGYVLSQYFDLWTFLVLRQFRFGRRSLVARAWVSLLLSQLIDTAVFIVIAFYGTIPLAGTIIGQYGVKLLFSTLAAPLVYTVVFMGRRYIGVSEVQATGEARS